RTQGQLNGSASVIGQSVWRNTVRLAESGLDHPAGTGRLFDNPQLIRLVGDVREERGRFETSGHGVTRRRDAGKAADGCYHALVGVKRVAEVRERAVGVRE